MATMDDGNDHGCDCNGGGERVTAACESLISSMPRLAACTAREVLGGFQATYGGAGGRGVRPMEEILAKWGLCQDDLTVQANWPFRVTLTFDGTSTVAEVDDAETSNWFIPRSLMIDALPRTVRIDTLMIDETQYVGGGIRADMYMTEELLRGVETDLIAPNRPVRIRAERLVPGPFSVDFTLIGDKLKLSPIAARRLSMILT